MSVHEDTATLSFHIEDHEVKLLRHLYAQTQEGRLHDVTLKAHGVTAHAHRAVLCAHSAYFEALLSSRWSDASVHDLSNLLWSGDTLRTLVDFMYTGKVVITKDTIDELLNTSTQLFLEDIRGACSKYLLANLAPKNCIAIWRMAEQYRLQEVEAMCLAIASSRFQDYLMKRDDMLELDQAFIEKIIRVGLFDAVAKDEVLQFVDAWQKYGDQHRMLSREVLELLSLPASLLSSSSPPPPPSPFTDDAEDMAAAQDSDRASENSHPSIAVSEGIPLDAHCSSEVTEAIFGYLVTENHILKGCKEPREFDIHMFDESRNSWKFVNHFDHDSWSFLLEAELVGFLGCEAVYDGGMSVRSALVHLERKTFKTLHFPNASAATRRMFCFDSQLFLLEDHKCFDDSHCVCHTLYIYEHSSAEWKKLLAFDVAELFPGFQTPMLLSYMVVSQKDSVFIWAQDHSSNCTGPFWMQLSRSPSHGYAITALERQPLSKEDLRLLTPFSLRGWKHASFKLTADNQQIHAYRMQTLRGNSLDYDLLLTYDKQTRSWTRRDNVSIPLPQNNTLPIHSSEQMGNNSKGYIQMDRSCAAQSLLHGVAYIIEKLCPFVARMWACRVATGRWQQLSPPPVECISGFRCFHVVTMRRRDASALGSAPVYSGVGEDASYSPMLYWDLCLTDKLSDIKLQTSVAQRIQQATRQERST